MASRKASEIEDSLKRKGFRLDERKDHRYLTLHVGERETSIQTKVSHGGRDYGDDLLSKVQKQLRLPR